MSDQSHSCDPKRVAKDRKLFMCFGALAIALAVGFGYSMATIRYQEMIYQHAELAAKERASLHNRYMRQINSASKQYFQLEGEYRSLAKTKEKE